MRLNPYSILLIIVFNATVSVTNKTIKNIKYEETINDSSFYLIDSIGFERQM
jgi:UDP-N-acetyl-D-mannosaminuronic acid transferase (WecB/TagA/CpsF family)